LGHAKGPISDVPKVDTNAAILGPIKCHIDKGKGVLVYEDGKLRNEQTEIRPVQQPIPTWAFSLRNSFQALNGLRTIVPDKSALVDFENLFTSVNNHCMVEIENHPSTGQSQGMQITIPSHADDSLATISN